MLAIYARKSTESEDRQVLSIDSQVRELKDCARAQGLTVGAVYTESKSAKAPGRPIFGEVIARIQKGEIDSLLCWKLDRLARNPVDGGALIWAMEEGHLTAIHSVQRSFNNTGNDKFWMQLEFGMAKKYVDDLSDNVKRGLRAKIAQGWMPGLPPLGYLNDRNTHTVVKDPERFAVVRKMWDLMLTGSVTPKRVLDVATESWGLRTRKFTRVGGGPMAYAAIYKMFTNPFYYGGILYNGELFEGAHPAMISQQEFARVQELLGLASRPRPQQHKFTYTGLIRCGECGAGITAEHKKQRHGHKYIYYHCTKKKRQVACSQRVIEERKLEEQISGFLGSLAIGKDIRDWSIARLRELHDEERQMESATLVSLNRRNEALQKEIGELVNMRLRGLLEDGEYLSKKAELETERLRLKELLNDNDGRLERILAACEDAFDFAHTALTRFQKGSPEQKRAALCFTGSNLTLTNGKLLIEPQKPLWLIQQAAIRQKLEKHTFEPALLGQYKAKNPHLGRVPCNWLTLVKDVRTFYGENSGVPTFKQTLARCTEITKIDPVSERKARASELEQRKEQRIRPRLVRAYEHWRQRPPGTFPRRRAGAGSVPSPTAQLTSPSSRSGRPAAPASGRGLCGNGRGGGRGTP